jgi:cell division control protein 6
MHKNTSNIIIHMADLFKDMLSADESLFTNEIALDYEYLPKELPHRENEQHYLAECIRLLLANRMGKNIIITGDPGIGKTAAVRWVLRELEEKGFDDKVRPIYINCWKKDTPHKIILEICDQIGYKWIQNRNTDELFREIANIINRNAAVFVLDEVDKLETEQIIYQLLEDINKKCIFLITNYREWLSELDARVKSRLTPETVEFKKYTLAETEDILRKRAKSAFVEGVWEAEALELIAQRAHDAGDLRYGIALLREAGSIAEKKGSRKIKKEHAEKAIEKMACFTARKESELDDDEKIMLPLIKQHAGKTGTELYELFKLQSDKAYRTFHRKLKSLEEAGLIEIEGDFTSNGGRVSKIRPKQIAAKKIKSQTTLS